jgi:hypothetical protein
MNATALQQKVNTRLGEFLDAPTVLGWFDDAQNQMAMMANAVFPQFLNPDGSLSGLAAPVFDNKYHEALVIYAIARYREQDSSLQEMTYMDKQFNAMLTEFARKYNVPPQYRDDAITNQYIATAGQLQYRILDDNFDQNYMNTCVYQNSNPVPFKTGTLKLTSPSMYIDVVNLDPSVTVLAGDVITIVWEDAPMDAYKQDNWVGW